MARTGRKGHSLSLLLALACCAAFAGKAPVCEAQTASVLNSREATTVAVNLPAGMAYDTAGNLYIAAANDNVVRKVDTSGLITIIAGMGEQGTGTGEQGFAGDGGIATAALLDTPTGVAVDADGNVYIADSHNQRIREVFAATGIIQTIAGTGAAGFGGDGGPATQAVFDLPTAISLDSAGDLYIADSNNQRIREIVNGTISTVAGTGEQGFSGDGGAATQALLNDPEGVAADLAVPGRFYLSDTQNQRVRMVDTDGIITTLAGTGAYSFGGDGGAGTAAGLANPTGLALDSSGLLYLADTDNERIRTVNTAGQITTVAGTGEQGFNGDTGPAASALLDTPLAAAAGTGDLAIADTNNGRVRAVAAQTINTVAGIAPPLTEGLLLQGPVSAVYGTPLTYTATFSNGSNTATGTMVLADSGTTLGTATLSANTATFTPTLSPGLHALAVTYAGDSANPAIASGLYLVRIAQAGQTIAFSPLPGTVSYPSAPVTLTATASSGLPVTYAATGPATVSGNTLTFIGAGTVTVTASQSGNADYAAVSSAQTIVVSSGSLAISALSPSTVILGASNVALSIAGSGFTTSSVVHINGAAVPTTFVSPVLLTAIVPQVSTLSPLSVVVVDSSTGAASAAASLTVTAPTPSLTLSVPSTAASDEQPVIDLQIGAPYPVALTATLQLAFTPSATPAVDDPAIQFASGGRTETVTIPAGATTVPGVAIQTGTVAGTITVTLNVTAASSDVTPPAARTATIDIPAQAPSATVTFTQSGTVVTAVVTGFSNTRNMTQAVFAFTGAQGTTLTTTSLTLPVDGIFGTWFGDTASDAYGSTFVYTQTFNLSDQGAKLGGISVTLTNSAGSGAPAASQ